MMLCALTKSKLSICTFMPNHYYGIDSLMTTTKNMAQHAITATIDENMWMCLHIHSQEITKQKTEKEEGRKRKKER